MKFFVFPQGREKSDLYKENTNLKGVSKTQTSKPFRPQTSDLENSDLETSDVENSDLKTSDPLKNDLNCKRSST